jgi:hypothetical protein
MAKTKKKTRAGGITKIEAVWRALGDLGSEAKAAQIQQYIKDKFGIDMSVDHITTNKGKIRRGEAGPRTAVATPAAAPATADQKTEPKKATLKPPAIKGGDGQANGIPLNDILYVKQLVGRFGPHQMHTLIDAFAS